MDGMTVMKNAGSVSGAPDREALELISEYFRKNPEADEIYTFSVTLCDNEIDRDCERFSVEALYTLKDMFRGVTGIFDHSMKSCDQKARIYKTQVISDPSRKTAAGEDYTCLKAWCYMLRTEENKELIREIDGGIKKEVSVSCAVDSYICSVCGKDMRSPECTHKTGSSVNGKLCHGILTSPTDAYEWSFVAVPAQKNAGVTKSFKKGKGRNSEKYTQLKTPEEIIKSFENSENDITLTKTQEEMIFNYVLEMKSKADAWEGHREKKEKELLAMCAFALPSADGEAMGKIFKKLGDSELDTLKNAFSEKCRSLNTGELQLKYENEGLNGKTVKASESDSQFKI